MCRSCNDTGRIVYGDETLSGQIEIRCGCTPKPALDCSDCRLVGDIEACLSLAAPCPVTPLRIAFGDRA
jgi:hypothetical protein